MRHAALQRGSRDQRSGIRDNALEKIGREYQETRERIREIENKALQKDGKEATNISATVHSFPDPRPLIPDPFFPQGSMPYVGKAFEYIGMAKVAMSAQEAREMLILNEKSRITMNRRRVLADAKELCINLSQNYAPPEPQTIRLPGASGKAALMMALEGYREHGKATAHDMVVGEALATVLSGGDTDLTREMTEQDILDLEHDVFMRIVKTPGSLARLEHMLETNKPLRN